MLPILATRRENFFSWCFIFRISRSNPSCVEDVDLFIVINKSKVCLKQADNLFTSLPYNKQKLETVRKPDFHF